MVYKQFLGLIYSYSSYLSSKLCW